MMKGFVFAIALVAAVMTTSSFQDGHQLCEGIVPENNLWIGVDDKSANGITEQEFNEIMDVLEDIYTPIFKEHGDNFKIIRNWTDGTVNAYANRAGSTAQIHMFGGLARYNGMNKVGMAMVACHEIGHHLGGKPKVTRFLFPSWASNEGQSDYFATLKCMRKYLRIDPIDISAYDLSTTAIDMCEKAWTSDEEIQICKVTNVGSAALAGVLNDLRGASTPVSFDTPDPKVVSKTDHKHPAAQCRLDTYFQGTLCDKDHNDEIDLSSETSAQCNRKDGYTTGVRPLCWYKPKR